MGVAVVVLFSLRQLDAEAAVPMLGLGLACLQRRSWAGKTPERARPVRFCTACIKKRSQPELGAFL